MPWLVVYSAFWVISIPVFSMIIIAHKYDIFIDIVKVSENMTKFGFRDHYTHYGFCWGHTFTAFGYELQIWRSVW